MTGDKEEFRLFAFVWLFRKTIRVPSESGTRIPDLSEDNEKPIEHSGGWELTRRDFGQC